MAFGLGRGRRFDPGKTKSFQELSILSDMAATICNALFYNYLQLLCREIIEFLLYRGFPRPIWPAKHHERSEGYLAGQNGQGNPK